MTTNYYYDGGRVIEECDGLDNDTLLATYVHGNGIDELLQAEYPIDSDQHPISGTYYFHENTLGSIYAVTDNNGVVVERYEYSIYGKVSFFDGPGTPISDSAIGNCYLYTGREYDPEIKLYNYRARYYSPDLGRFLQRDPEGYMDGLNLYEYAQSSPTCFVDPLGTLSEEATNLMKALSAKGESPEVRKLAQKILDKEEEVKGLAEKKMFDEANNVFNKWTRPAIDKLKDLTGFDLMEFERVNAEVKAANESGTRKRPGPLTMAPQPGVPLEHAEEYERAVQHVEIEITEMLMRECARAYCEAVLMLGTDLAAARIIAYVGALQPIKAISEKVLQSGLRFFGKAPEAANVFKAESVANGTTRFMYEVPGKVPGSKAIYEKVVDSTGKTISVIKKTYDPQGKLIHLKDKLNIK